MFRFEHSTYLYALAVLPILAAFFSTAWYYRKRAINRFGNPKLMTRIMPEMSRYKHAVKFMLITLALTFLIVGWANPQWGIKKETVPRKGIDLFIALDISQSMLAEDISPSRLIRARRFAQNLVTQLRGENIGVIIFACNAYLQVPLTTDYAFVNMFLGSANPDMANAQGTTISEAIDLAERSFKEENKNHKALVIITDGEDHDGTAKARAAEAQENGLMVFTVGVGKAEGSFMPINAGGRSDYKRDNQGNPIRTSLNEAMLMDIAEAGKGNYFNLSAGTDRVVDVLKKQIDAIEKREFEARVFNEYESYFQYFIGLGLLFLIIEFMVAFRKNRYLANKDIFKV
ncbi:MAG: membrane protein [Saprospiraceae bacterium]|nr:MAG: membrane protein [Saprospiraceae bacterium]